MSYDVRRLRYFVDDSSGQLVKNGEVAKQFFLAEDDCELAEIVSLMDSMVHYSSFWGVSRGSRASLAVHMHEQEKLRLLWSSDVKPLTGQTFYREGFVEVLDPPGGWSVPIFSRLYHKIFKDRVRESLVLRDGKVIFRHLGYDWGLARW